MNDPLADLRDIVLPPVPAAVPDWLMVAGVAAAFASAVALLVLAFRRRPPWQRAALTELDRIASGPREAALPAAAALLRRVALQSGGNASATMTGDAWLTRLDGLFATRFFTQGAGRIFGNALYRPGAEPPDRLFTDLRRLLSRRRLARGAAR